MAPRDPFMLNACTVYPSSNVLRSTAGESTLQPRIMKILVCLAEHAPHTVTRHELLERGWDEAGYVADEAVTRAISDLRKALRQVGCRDEVIRTVPKTGYRLVVMPVWQATSVAPVYAEGASIQPIDRERPPSRLRPFVRGGVTTRLALAVSVVGMIGLSVFVGTHLAASPEPQIRMVRRVMHVDPSVDAQTLLPASHTDTLFVKGDEARRIIDMLNADESLSIRVDTDS